MSLWTHHTTDPDGYQVVESMQIFCVCVSSRLRITLLSYRDSSGVMFPGWKSVQV